MIVYMLRSEDNKNRYYEKVTDSWVEQERASVWSEKWAVSCNKWRVYARRPCKIVSFTLEEI